MRVIEPLGKEDLDILRLESRSVAGHTLKIAVLQPSGHLPRPDVDSLRRHVAARLSGAPLLRCRLREGRRGVAPAWVDDPTFDVRRHVRPLPVSERGSSPTADRYSHRR